MRAYVALASGLFAAAALGVGCRVDLPEFVPGDEPDGSVPPDARYALHEPRPSSRRAEPAGFRPWPTISAGDGSSVATTA